jgi:pimeloyl-ACP methyl ester carboxylesterase
MFLTITEVAPVNPSLCHAVLDVRHRFLAVRGARIHVAEVGDPAAPAVVLLHGFPQHWRVWRPVMADLAADHHVIAVDLPGFGRSDPATHGYSTAERVRDLLALLDELGIADADLVGHDWGGRLAFRVALDAPARVRRLVSICEPHPWPLRRRLWPNLWRMWVTTLFELPGLGTFAQRRRRLVRWFLTRDAGNPAVWTDDLVDAYAAPTARSATARAGQRLHAAFIVHDIPRLILRRDRHRRFDVPTLLVGGTHDTYIPLRLLTVPTGRTEHLRTHPVEGGHFLIDDNPRGVVAAIRTHLGDRRPGRSDPSTDGSPGRTGVDARPGRRSR